MVIKMTSYIIILSLILIYTYSICSIFGSISLWNEKDCGGLKGKLLKFGYKYSIYWTNFVGLTLTGLLQLSPLYVVSFWFSLGSLTMPTCYTIAVKYFGDTKYAEYSYGFCYGILMLIAVIGG